MNSAEKEAVLHCLKSMIDEEVCEECPLYGTTGIDHCEKDCVRLAINTLSSSENPNKWIPITSRPMTEEEKKDFAERTGYDEKDFDDILSCPLPEDGETVLITDRLGNVEVDTFINDCDGCYFECNCDMEDVKAWMPLPQPYQPEIPTVAEGG